MINNNAPHLKSPKNQNKERPWDGQQKKILEGFNQFAVDQTSPLDLPWFPRHLVVWFAWKIPSS